MSAAARNPDGYVPLDDKDSAYAPKRARRPVHDQHEIDAPARVEVDSPPAIVEPPWKRRTLEPDWLPPPPPTRTLAWPVGIIVGAAAGALGSIWVVGYLSDSAPAPQKPLASAQIHLVAKIVADPSAARPATSGLARVSPGDNARPAANGVANEVQRRVPSAPELRSVSTPAALAPSVPPSTSNVAQFNRQNSPDPASAPATPKLLDAAEIAVMMKGGAEFIANGNIAAARMMFRPAAEAGDPAAAFALAETYDPLVLAKLGAKGGITPDVALAQRWYAKANELGYSASAW
jgi:TPR repeat protein